MISNYEARFLQVRTIIEKQDVELRSAHDTLSTVRNNLAEEETLTKTLKERIEELQL